MENDFPRECHKFTLRLVDNHRRFDRGLNAVRFIVSDDHAGLAAARRAAFPSVPWQRCQFHLQQNAQADVPRLDLRSIVAADIRSIFNCADLVSARARLKERFAHYGECAPKLAEWMEQNLPKGLDVYALPEAHRRLSLENAGNV